MASTLGNSALWKYLDNGQGCHQPKINQTMAKRPTLEEKYAKWTYLSEKSPSFCGWYAIRKVTNNKTLRIRPTVAYWTSKKWTDDLLSTEEHPDSEKFFCYITETCATKEKALELASEYDPDEGC